MSGGADLAGEFAAAAWWRHPAVDAVARWLVRAGFGPAEVAACGSVGVARVRAEAGGLYEPDEAGALRAVIVPVWAGAAPRIGEAALVGELVDLVAWVPPSGPALRRLGVADLLGGAAAEVMGEDRQVRVFATPPAWARATAADWWAGDSLETVPRRRAWPAGVVVLDWAGCWEALKNAASVVAEDLATGKLLDKHLRPPRLARPRILVAEPADGRRVA